MNSTPDGKRRHVFCTYFVMPNSVFANSSHDLWVIDAKLGTIDRHQNREGHKGVGKRRAPTTKENTVRIPPRMEKDAMFLYIYGRRIRDFALSSACKLDTLDLHAIYTTESTACLLLNIHISTNLALPL